MDKQQMIKLLKGAGFQDWTWLYGDDIKGE